MCASFNSMSFVSLLYGHKFKNAIFVYKDKKLHNESYVIKKKNIFWLIIYKKKKRHNKKPFAVFLKKNVRKAF